MAWPNTLVDIASNGVCCSCGHSGEEETDCPVRGDRTHCVHWFMVATSAGISIHVGLNRSALGPGDPTHQDLMKIIGDGVVDFLGKFSSRVPPGEPS